MWQKHVSYLWFGRREGVIIPATRKRMPAKHRLCTLANRDFFLPAGQCASQLV
jgi:hypothetical protein